MQYNCLKIISMKTDWIIDVNVAGQYFTVETSNEIDIIEMLILTM